MHITDKSQLQKPQMHLKAGGDFYQNTESTDNFVHPCVKQAQEMAEWAKDNNEEDRWRNQEEERKKDEEMKMLVSKLEDLNGRPLEIPE